MANTIRSSGTVTITTNSATIRPSIAFDLTMSGSNVVYEAKNVDTSGYQALSTSSLSDIRVGTFTNTTSGSVVLIARDSGGTNIISVLEYDESAFIPMSGSIGAMTLYAKALNSASVLEYALAEK